MPIAPLFLTTATVVVPSWNLTISLAPLLVAKIVPGVPVPPSLPIKT